MLFEVARTSNRRQERDVSLNSEDPVKLVHALKGIMVKFLYDPLYQLYIHRMYIIQVQHKYSLSKNYMTTTLIRPY